MTSRYYDSCSKEDEIKPGKISNELRDALNLPDNDLPIWIYRMRALGYPPGWLKKAVVDTSDIFDTDSTSDDGPEGSRKRKNSPNEMVQYDHSKLIEYPGFNSPMPENCVDYHYYMNMPAMLDFQQLEYAKKHMSAFKPVQIPKRIRLTTSNNVSSQSLDESNGGSIDRSNEDPESPDSNEESAANKTSADGEVVSKSASNTSLTDGIKLLSKGSPMPKPVERAPLEKFSEGVVGELLYFENLPASTGKFDSIRGLLNTIRRSKSLNDASFEASNTNNDDVTNNDTNTKDDSQQS